MGKNAYEIIGTSRQAVEIDISGKKRGTIEQDAFIKDKAEHILKILEIRYKGPNRNKIEKEQIQEEASEIRKAYEQIRTSEAREIYNSILEEQTKESNKISIPREPDAYQILATSKMQINGEIRTEEQVDAMLKQRKESLIKLAQKDLVGDFRKRQQAELEIRKIEEAYEKIKDKRSRILYNTELIEKNERRRKQNRENLLKQKYDKRELYDEGILDSSVGPIYTRFKEPVKHVFYRKDGTPVTISNTGEIKYRNFTGVFNSSINEYKVFRKKFGKEVSDIIYTNLSIFDMSIDKRTKQPIVNSKYYEYVLNELLSEESIEGCTKYNHGYVGTVEKDKDGTYYTTFNNKEELSAVMKIYGEKDKKRLEERGK